MKVDYLYAIATFYLQTYVVVIVGFRGRGVWAWLVTMVMLVMICTLLSINLWVGQLLDWRSVHGVIPCLSQQTI